MSSMGFFKVNILGESPKTTDSAGTPTARRHVVKTYDIIYPTEKELAEARDRSATPLRVAQAAQHILHRAEAAASPCFDSKAKIFSLDSTEPIPALAEEVDLKHKLNGHKIFYVNFQGIEELCEKIKDKLNKINDIKKEQEFRELLKKYVQLGAMIYTTILSVAAFFIPLVVKVALVSAAGASLATPVGLAIIASAVGIFAMYKLYKYIEKQRSLAAGDESALQVELDKLIAQGKRLENEVLKPHFPLNEAPLVFDQINRHFNDRKSQAFLSNYDKRKIQTQQIKTLIEFEDVMVELYTNEYTRRVINPTLDD